MNIEIDQPTLEELEHAFKFNDAVLRHLTIKTKAAVVVPSAMMKEEKSRSYSGDAADIAPAQLAAA
jgi:small subunit ribosomal protein S6